MIALDCLEKYRRVTVVGLGLFGGGEGAARFFAGRGARVTVTDTADEEKLAKSVANLAGREIRFVLGRHEEADFANTDLVVANQAVRPENPFLQIARERGIPVVTETGLALALNPAPWIGVTGSAGKSTTAALLHAMIRRHDPAAILGGNIGGDLLTRVERRPAKSPVVAELSSYQLTWIARDMEEGSVPPPAVSVFTNITRNHLDWHRDMDEYVQAKQALALHQKRGAWAVLNYEDERLRGWRSEIPCRTLWTSRRDSGEQNACFLADASADDGNGEGDGAAVVLRLDGEERARFPLDRFRLLGGHNRVNALQAAAAAWIVCGGDADAVRFGLADFPGLPHRLEIVGDAGGRTFVNDSKSTTPESAITALRAVNKPCVLIAGGYDKHSPFEKLGEEIQKRAVALVLFGASAPRIREAAAAAAALRPRALGALPLAEAGDDFTLAVETAWRAAPPGGIVLLSPACASWGMFSNYEARGAAFRDIAKRLDSPCSRNSSPSP